VRRRGARWQYVTRTSTAAAARRWSSATPPTAHLKIVNDPSDHRERAVADVIGVTVQTGDYPTTRPASD
jgi:hypothetical protein